MFKGFKVLVGNELKLIKKILKQRKDVDLIIKQIIKFRNITISRDVKSLRNILKKWINSKIALSKTFMRGVDDDIEVITNCVKHRETNGVAERKINKLKISKKILYGKVSPELLKDRDF